MDLLGESPPEHGLLGRLLILLLHCAGLTLWGVIVFEGPGTLPLGMAIFALLIPFTCAYVAESLRRFECWSWFTLMFILCPAALGLFGDLLFDTSARQVPGMA